jgi:hypothetical protein
MVDSWVRSVSHGVLITDPKMLRGAAAAYARLNSDRTLRVGVSVLYGCRLSGFVRVHTTS